MDSEAQRIAEFLNQPVKIWMVVGACLFMRLLRIMRRHSREQAYQRQVISGFIKRSRTSSEERAKKLLSDHKPSGRRNTDLK